MIKSSPQKADIKIKEGLRAAGIIVLMAVMLAAFMPLSPMAGAAAYGAEETSLWEIKIGDEAVTYVGSEEAANQVIAGLKTHYLSENSKVISVTIENEADIKVNEVKPSALNMGYTDENGKSTMVSLEGITVQSAEEAIATVTKGKEVYKVYTSKEGETVSSIGQNLGCDPEWLRMVNYSLRDIENEVEPGTIIAYRIIEPYVIVNTVETLTTVKEIKYDTKYKKTPAMDVDQSKVSVKGKNGKREIVNQVTKVNGEITADEVISNKITLKPVDKVILKGTGSIEAKRGKTYSFAEGSDVAKFARKYEGNPYHYGGSSLTKGADCSGFVMSVFAHFGLDLPRMATEQRYCGRSVAYKYAKPGDIIYYPGHSAIYIGNGKIVHAMNPYRDICISSARYAPIISVRRVFEDK